MISSAAPKPTASEALKQQPLCVCSFSRRDEKHLTGREVLLFAVQRSPLYWLVKAISFVGNDAELMCVCNIRIRCYEVLHKRWQLIVSTKRQ